jgi:hypothetical protein
VIQLTGYSNVIPLRLRVRKAGDLSDEAEATDLVVEGNLLNPQLQRSEEDRLHLKLLVVILD